MNRRIAGAHPLSHARVQRLAFRHLQRRDFLARRNELHGHVVLVVQLNQLLVDVRVIKFARAGFVPPWNIGKFYGTSYFCDPRGKFLAEGSEDKDELVVAEMNLDVIEEVRRTWQFYRDRRPETYDALTEV